MPDKLRMNVVRDLNNASIVLICQSRFENDYMNDRCGCEETSLIQFPASA